MGLEISEWRAEQDSRRCLAQKDLRRLWGFWPHLFVFFLLISAGLAMALYFFAGDGWVYGFNWSFSNGLGQGGRTMCETLTYFKVSVCVLI